MCALVKLLLCKLYWMKHAVLSTHVIPVRLAASDDLQLKQLLHELAWCVKH